MNVCLNLSVAITLFGGQRQDDQLRGISPSGRRVSGLFDQALRSYKDDPRAGFVYALSEGGISQIEGTVRSIRDNGNFVTFNYYSKHGTSEPLARREDQLLDEALRVKDKFPETVVSDPYFIRTLISGKSHWDAFGYEVCPSISSAHPAHSVRLGNGNPVLPGFNTYAADASTVQFCCTSGNCAGCRDSQAVYSWLISSVRHFSESTARFAEWISIAESYWKQFPWSPYRRESNADVPHG